MAIQHVPVNVAAEALGVSEKHIYRLLREGLLRSICISTTGSIGPRTVRVCKDSLNLFIKKRTINPQDFGEKLDIGD